MDKVAAAGVQGHVVRLPVYPKIDYNGGSPTCSPLSLPGRDRPHRELHADDAGLRVRLRHQDPQAGGRLRDQQEPVRDHRFSPNRQRHHGHVGGRRDHLLDGHRAAVRQLHQRDLRALQRADRHRRQLGRAQAGRAGLDQHHPRRRAQEHHHRSVQQLGPAPGRRSERPAHGDEPDVHGPRLPEQLEEQRRSRRRSRPRWRRRRCS